MLEILKEKFVVLLLCPSTEGFERLVSQGTRRHSHRFPDLLSNTSAAHIWCLGTEGADVHWWKASTIDVDALGVKPVVARFTAQVS